MNTELTEKEEERKKQGVVIISSSTLALVNYEVPTTQFAGIKHSRQRAPFSPVPESSAIIPNRKATLLSHFASLLSPSGF